MRVRLIPVLSLAAATSIFASEVAACRNCNRGYAGYGYLAPPVYSYSPPLPPVTTVGTILRNYCRGRTSAICTGRPPQAYGYVDQAVYYGYRKRIYQPRVWGWRSNGYHGWRRW
jgi:hypothetical protein